MLLNLIIHVDVWLIFTEWTYDGHAGLFSQPGQDVIIGWLTELSALTLNKAHASTKSRTHVKPLTTQPNKETCCKEHRHKQYKYTLKVMDTKNTCILAFMSQSDQSWLYNNVNNDSLGSILLMKCHVLYQSSLFSPCVWILFSFFCLP